MAAAAIPIATSVIGGALAARGSKKAAKSAKGPDVPSIFKPYIGQALGLLSNRLQSGFLPYPGPLTAGIQPLQGQALDLAGSLINTPQANEGLLSAFNTVRGVAETGLDPAQIELIRKQLDPFFNFQREQGLAQTREAGALRGGFYGSGSQGAEATFLANLESQRAAQVLPLALQIRQLQLQAAQGVPSYLTAALQPAQAAFGLGEGARQIQQQDISARFAEFLRTQPEAAIPLLASLLSGTPFYQPPIAPNALQTIGGSLSNLASSPGFLSLFQGGTPSSKQGQMYVDPFTGKVIPLYPS